MTLRTVAIESWRCNKSMAAPAESVVNPWHRDRPLTKGTQLNLHGVYNDRPSSGTGNSHFNDILVHVHLLMPACAICR